MLDFINGAPDFQAVEGPYSHVTIQDSIDETKITIKFPHILSTELKKRKMKFYIGKI